MKISLFYPLVVEVKGKMLELTVVVLDIDINKLSVSGA